LSPFNPPKQLYTRFDEARKNWLEGWPDSKTPTFPSNPYMYV